MSKTCEDCGTKICSGFCPNCQEEAYIFETQAEDFGDMQFSDAFIAKVAKQQKARRL